MRKNQFLKNNFRVFRFFYIALFISIVAFCHPDLYAGEQMFSFSSEDSVIFQVGEELTYNVSYLFDIGQIRIKILEKLRENGKTIYSAIAYIDSYKGVPFVDLHTIYETKMQNPLVSKWFRARTKDNATWRHITYDLDYDKKTISVDKGIYGTNIIESHKNLPLDTIFQDGLSLFFFARANVSQKKLVNVPTIIQEEKVNTSLNFTDKHTSEEIDAVDYPIDVVQFDGRADFVGIFGLTGEFEGWFSNDAAKVPIVAKMQVIVGKVRVELMKWKRDGWVPPKARD